MSRSKKITGWAIVLILLFSSHANAWFTKTPTKTPTKNPTATSTRTFTATYSLTSSATNTPSQTPTATITWTPTSSFTPTETWTETPTFTATWTPTHTPSDTPTWTATFTATATYSPTATSTATLTPQPTPTATLTFTATPPCGARNPYLYPSPASGATATIAYNLCVPALVQVRVYNEVGDLMETLQEEKSAGPQTTLLTISRLAQGVYFFLITTRNGQGSIERMGPFKFTVIR